MNIRLIISPGTIIALIGGIIPLALPYLGQPKFNRLKYQSQVYQRLHSRDSGLA
jgi:hypothetical protein